jgi:hypothetical protein
MLLKSIFAKSLPPVLKIIAVILATIGLIYILGWSLFLIPLFEPWPLSLRQGSDTSFARNLYEQTPRHPLPTGVPNLDARAEWDFGGYTIYSIKFNFTDNRLIQNIGATLRLEVAPKNEIKTLRILSGPKWWPSKNIVMNSDKVYRRKEADIYGWIGIK